MEYEANQIADKSNASSRANLSQQDEIERAGLVEAVEQSANAIVISDPMGTIRYVNPAFTDMTGYSREEAIGRNPRILKSGRQSEDFYKGVWDTITSGRVWQGELINRRKNGTFYTEEMRISPVRDAHGEIVSYIAIKQDVTERRTAEEAKRFLASIVECSEDAIIANSPGGTILTWNQGAEALLGYSAEEIIGCHISMLVEPRQAEFISPFIDRVLTARVGCRCEALLVRKDGQKVSVCITANPILDSGGRAVALAAIIRDITKRKQAEESRALLASVVESSADAIVSGTLDGKILGWNKSAEMLFGYSAVEAIGADYLILAPPELRHEVSQAIAKARDGSVTHYDTVRLAKDGRRIHVAVTVSPIWNSRGEVAGAAVTMHDIGKRVLAEQKLRDSEERFRSAFENAPLGMCLCAVDGRLLQVNESLSRMLGFSEGELLASSWPKLTYPEDYERSAEAVRQMLTGSRDCLELEKRYVHRSGNIVWARTRLSLVRNPDGSPLHFVIHIEDITQRRRAEETLRESEARFRIMADSCPTLIWVTDEDGQVKFINRTYREFFGIDYEDVEGGKWTPLVHPGDAPRYIEDFRRSVEQQKPYRAEARVRRAGGEWRWIASYAEPRFSGVGGFLGHVGISQDIHERRSAEDALRRSEEKFRQLAENIREVFWIMDADATEMVYVSPAYQQVWGRTCESLYRDPMSWLETIHPEDADLARSWFASRTGEDPGECEYRIRTPDGGHKWIRDRAFPIHNQAGEIVRFAGIAEDITDRRQYEDELVRAREAAEAANIAKSRFLANMSHEIRTPMNGVIGMLQLLMETDLTPQQRDYAAVIESSGRTLLALIDDILDLSKIEARKITIERLDFNLHRCVEEVVQALRHRAFEKGLGLGWRAAADTPSVMRGDPKRLSQILTNLVANAIKFTHRGEIEVTVETESRAVNMVTLRFSIRDTGIGIRPEQGASLFAPFVQADASTTRKYGGTGLGLAISKQLVEMMGGKIGFDSKIGEGSTFWFTVIFEAIEESRYDGVTPQQIPFGGGGLVPEQKLACQLRRKSARILVVEDNHTNQQVFKAQLDKLGYDAVLASSGAEALEELQRKHFDLVLMDCQMPGMDGFETTRVIRKLGFLDIPVIAVTANAMQGDRERCIGEGMNDYLAKPTQLSSLAASLAKWLPDTEASAAGEDKGIFDESDLLRRLSRDRNLASHIVNGFVRDFPRMLSDLRKALEESDSAAASLWAHTLYGAASAVSAPSLGALARDMERAGEAGYLSGVNDLLPSAAAEFERLRCALQQAGWIQAAR